MVSAPATGKSTAAHIKNAKQVLWFACRKPATPADVRLGAGGKLLMGMCR